MLDPKLCQQFSVQIPSHNKQLKTKHVHYTHAWMPLKAQRNTSGFQYSLACKQLANMPTRWHAHFMMTQVISRWHAHFMMMRWHTHFDDRLYWGDTPTLWCQRGDTPTLWWQWGDTPTLWWQWGDMPTLWWQRGDTPTLWWHRLYVWSRVHKNGQGD